MPLFAYLSQSSYILDKSIKDNIIMDMDFDKERFNHACFVSCLMDEQLEKLLVADLPLSQGGADLSGGQRQRLALARAIYSNAPVLLLDEATSALDVRTENTFFERLVSCCDQHTIILVSHSPNPLRYADQCLQLN